MCSSVLSSILWLFCNQPPELCPCAKLKLYADCVKSLQSCLTLCDPYRLWPARLLCPWGFSRQEHWSGLPFPPPGISPTHGLNTGLPHCRQILYRLSHQGSPPCVCVCVCVCTQISPFYKDSSYTDLGASSAPDDFIKLITSAKNLVPSKSHSGALGVRIAIYGFLGDN